MKYRFSIIAVFCLVCIISSVAQACVWCRPIYCNGCWHCVNNACVSKCTSSQECCDGSCISKCDPDKFESCSGGSCKDRCDSLPCKKCDGHGNCISSCDYAECEGCVDGKCKVCNGDPDLRCEGEECVCSGGCWVVNPDPIPAVVETCPDCDGFFTGCNGMVRITSSYYLWETATGYGYCKNPTKSVTIGALHECTEDWDVDTIVACAISAGLSGASCFVNIPVCIGALIAGGYSCLDDGVCTLVDECIQGEALEPPIQEEAIDWEAEWGLFTKCGT